MMQTSNTYLSGLQYVLDNGVTRGDRTGVGRHSVFSPPEERYNVSNSIPLETTREIKPQAAIDELIWFISGSKSIEDLKTKFFWKNWAVSEQQYLDYMNKYHPLQGDEKHDTQHESIGTIGRMYGNLWRDAPAPVGKNCIPERTIDQLPYDLLESKRKKFMYAGRNIFLTVESFKNWLNKSDQELCDKIRTELITEYWSHFDQLNELVINLKTRPFSSRHRVTAAFPQFTAFEDFSIAENIIDGRAALTPCHTFFQCYVTENKDISDKKLLSLKLYMSSNDYPVGRVYNIFQYSVLLCMLAQVTDMQAHEFIITTGDGHIYTNQIEMVKEQLTRTPYPYPELWLNPDIKDITQFTSDDIKVLNYQFHPAIKYPVAV